MARPPTPAMLQILVALTEGPKHGYAIMLDAAAAGGRELGPGTLYRSLRQLLDAGMIEEVEGLYDDTDERRRYYRLTGGGREAAADEVARLDSLVRTARRNGLLTGRARPAER